MTEASSEPSKILFEEEQSRLYMLFADNHRQPQGPWTKMLDAIQEISKKNQASEPFRILDLASGMGEPALTIAKALPNAQVTSTDISPHMVEAAAVKSKMFPNMNAELADMMNLKQFQDDSIDIVTCCYGFMFPPNKETAVKEAFRVIKPGGSLVATTWNVFNMKFPRDVMEHILGKPPPRPAIDPLTLSEPGLFEGMLQRAGFENLQVSEHEYSFNLGESKDTIFKLMIMVILDKLQEMNAIDQARSFFDENWLKYGELDDDGNYLIHKNIYKHVVAQKPKGE